MTDYLSKKIKEISFFSMIMVVVLHSYNLDTKQSGVIIEFKKGYIWFVETFVSYGITRIAVPLFFLISGYLFFLGFKNEKNEILNKIKKRFKTLVIPYLFWVLFGIVFYLALQSFPQSQQFFTKKLIKNYDLLDWFNAVFVNIIPYQLWFLRDLIVMVFLSPIIYFVIKKANYFYLLILAPLWVLNQDNIIFTSEAIFFFSIGSYFAINKSTILEKRDSNYAFVFFALWLVVLIIKTVLEQQYDKESIYIIFLLKTSIIIGLFSVWTLYDSYKKRFPINLSVFDKVIAFSFFIYVFHEPLLTIIKKVLFKLLGTNEVDYFIIYLASPIITLCMTVICGIVLKNSFPKIYKVINGNR